MILFISYHIIYKIGVIFSLNRNTSGKITSGVGSGGTECIMRHYLLSMYNFNNGIATATLDSITGYTLDSAIAQLSASDTVVITACSVNTSTRVATIKCKKITDGSNFTGDAGVIRLFAIYKKS